MFQHWSSHTEQHCLWDSMKHIFFSFIIIKQYVFFWELLVVYLNSLCKHVLHGLTMCHGLTPAGSSGLGSHSLSPHHWHNREENYKEKVNLIPWNKNNLITEITQTSSSSSSKQKIGRERNKTDEKQMIHKTVAHMIGHWWTPSLFFSSEQWVPANSAQFAHLGNVLWCWISLWPVQVSCPGCAASWLLVHALIVRAQEFEKSLIWWALLSSN